MPFHPSKLAAAALFLGLLLVSARGQEPMLPPLPSPIEGGAAAAPDADAPKGVEVLARGPVHEAFAAPTVEPKAAPSLAKKPPTPLEELPPDEKPEGDVLWINGYWAFDDERNDFLWVSGCWRTRPPGKEWIAGYWRERDDQWQWVPGFWANATTAGKTSEATYYPEPPAPPAVAPPGAAPTADAFFAPGHWVWRGDRYVWQPGYWARIQSGYVWVPSHYRWTPHGYVFIGGYWDLAVTRRGILYAPVAVDIVVVGPRYVHTPRYAVCDAVVLDALFVRPAYGHYYFGDYYGPAYQRRGYEAVVVYSRRSYDPVIVYERWGHRSDPRWLEVQVDLTHARDAGRAPVPPRTLVQQQNITKVTNVTHVTNVYNTTVIAPTKVVASARGEKTVALDAKARTEVHAAARAAQTAAIKERKVAESAAPGVAPTKPRVASFSTTTGASRSSASTGAASTGAASTTKPLPAIGVPKTADVPKATGTPKATDIPQLTGVPKTIDIPKPGDPLLTPTTPLGKGPSSATPPTVTGTPRPSLGAAAAKGAPPKGGPLRKEGDRKEDKKKSKDG
jgi:hypothetical protein